MIEIIYESSCGHTEANTFKSSKLEIRAANGFVSVVEKGTDRIVFLTTHSRLISASDGITPEKS